MSERRVGVVVAIGVALLAGAAIGQDVRVEYTGELIDDGGRPLGGVFALEFKLYDSPDATTPLWSESHYVAVLDGEYRLELGTEAVFDPELVGRDLFVAVEFQEQEILREELTLLSPEDEQREDPLLAVLREQGMSQVTFAQLADRALYAEQADEAGDCATLNGRTAAELDRYEEILDRLTDHQTDPNAHGNSERARLDGPTQVLQRIGGDGGNRYTRMCPTGHVVVGMRGGAGGLVDSIELVCAPLE